MASLNEPSQLSNDSNGILPAQQLRHLESAIRDYLEEDCTPGCLNSAVFGAEGDRNLGDMLEDSLRVDYNGEVRNEVIWITRVKNDLLQPNLYQFFSTMIETMTFPLILRPHGSEFMLDSE